MTKKVKLLVDIWDDGEDHHPPGRLAKAGEVLNIVSENSSYCISVAHEGVTDSSFKIFKHEFERL